MEYRFSIPDDMELRNFSPCFLGKKQGYGFRAAISPRGNLYLQANTGVTPQEAVDAAVERVRTSLEIFKKQQPISSSSTLSLDDLDF